MKLTFYIDVDDTLIRNAGPKRIPMTLMVERLLYLAEQGADIYLWSAGGEGYCGDVARELGITHVIKGYLPKPNIIIDDMTFRKWYRFAWLHPNEAQSLTMEEFEREIIRNQR